MAHWDDTHTVLHPCVSNIEQQAHSNPALTPVTVRIYSKMSQTSRKKVIRWFPSVEQAGSHVKWGQEAGFEVDLQREAF